MLQRSRFLDSDMSLKNCTFIKTLLMLLVVLGHSLAFWSGGWFSVTEPFYEAKSIGILSDWIGSFHIYAFTLVSGYIFAYKMRRGYCHYKSFLKNKVQRLLIPYTFAASMWVAPISQYFFHWPAADLLKKYVLCINPSQLWFLWMLFWVFVLAWPLWKYLSVSFFKGAIVSLVCYGIGAIGLHLIPNIFCIWTGFQYLPFFFIGIQIRSYQEKMEDRKIPIICWVLLDLMLFTIEILTKKYLLNLLCITILTEFLLHLVGAVMAFEILQKVGSSAVKLSESKLFNKLAKYSMPIYLFHQQIIYFVIIWLNGRVNPYVNVIFNFIIAITGSYFISCLLMKFKITKYFVTGRKK